MLAGICLQMGVGKAESLRDIAAAATADMPEKASSALLLLGNHGLEARPFRNVMALGLMRNNPMVRQAAARALALSGPGAGLSVYTMVSGSDSFARVNAVLGFSLMGAEGVGPLRRLVTEDPNATVRREAARVLGKMGDAAVDAIPDLKLTLMDPDNEVRVAGKGALSLLSCAQTLLKPLAPASCYGLSQ